MLWRIGLITTLAMSVVGCGKVPETLAKRSFTEVADIGLELDMEQLEQLAKEAEQFPYDRARFREALEWALSIEQEMEQTPRPLTEDEWAKVKQWAADPVPEMRMLALDLCEFTIHDPSRRPEAVQIARQLLNDPAWIVRSTAIFTLRDLDAREAAPEIAKLLHDPVPFVREDAQDVLKAWGYLSDEVQTSPQPSE